LNWNDNRYWFNYNYRSPSKFSSAAQTLTFGRPFRCSRRFHNAGSILHWWYLSLIVRVYCNLSGGVALIVWFTTNGMCAKNKNMYAWSKQGIIREIATHDLYCCLLPRCEALPTCRSGFPITTSTFVIKLWNFVQSWTQARNQGGFPPYKFFRPPWKMCWT